MPRYYFDTDDGEKVILDTVGIYFDSIAVANQQSIQSLLDMAKSRSITAGSINLATTVRDDNGDTIYKATLQIEGCGPGDPNDG